MDNTFSTGQLALELGTSIPRIHWAVKRGEIVPIGKDKNNRLRFSLATKDLLIKSWGLNLNPEVSTSEARILTVLLKLLVRRASAREIARLGHLSPTTVSKVLDKFEKEGVVTYLKGYGFGLTNSPAVTAKLREVRKSVILPGNSSRGHSMSPPKALRRLFWDVDFSSLKTKKDQAFILNRIFESTDYGGTSWALTSYPKRTLRLTIQNATGVPSKKRWQLLFATASSLQEAEEVRVRYKLKTLTWRERANHAL